MNTLLPGFSTLHDILANRLVDDNTIQAVDTAVQQTLELHNQHTQAMVALFCDPTTDFKRRFKIPGQAYLQPNDGEFTRNQPVKHRGTYDIAFPMASAGIAWGWTRRERIAKTVQEANDQLNVLLDADRRYIRYNILAALFANADYTFEDQEHGTLIVKPLANGDTQEYLTLAGAETPSTADHFMAQAAAILDASNPFPTIYSKLNSRPENGEGRVISFVPTNLVDDCQALATFIEEEDPDIRPGANSSVLVGALDNPLPGNVIGKVGKVWICEWKALPDNYILSIHTGGPRPLAMRQLPEPELQGFQAVGERNDHPYVERYYERHVGFGVQNRLSAVITRIGNGTYAIPSGWTRADVM